MIGKQVRDHTKVQSAESIAWLCVGDEADCASVVRGACGGKGHSGAVDLAYAT